MSSAAKLRVRLSDLTERVAALIRNSPVEQMSTSGVIYVGPQFYFGKLSVEQQGIQLLIKREYDRWIERVRLLLAGAPDKLKRQIDKVSEQCERWIEQKTNWAVRPNPELNVQQMRRDFAAALSLLDVSRTRRHTGVRDPRH